MSGTTTTTTFNLYSFTKEDVQLSHERKIEALKCWQPIVKEILDYVTWKDPRFAFRHLSSGSYFERTKVKEPDEFDLMLDLVKLELDDDPYDSDEDDGLSEPPTGFTTVMIDKGEEKLWQPDQCVNRLGMLNATNVKAVFERLVREAIITLKYGSFVFVTNNGPAVTLTITDRDGREYSVDLTLAIKDHYWPEDAEKWRTRRRPNGWPKQTLVEEICQDGCHLVGKHPKDLYTPEKDFLWRYSFSAAEKKLFLNTSVSSRQLLRVIKALKETRDLEPLTSYHLKTIFLYECEEHPPESNESSFSCVEERFLSFLTRLKKCLKDLNCPHYFIKNLNLFSLFGREECYKLAKTTRKISQSKQVLMKLHELNELISDQGDDHSPAGITCEDF